MTNSPTYDPHEHSTGEGSDERPAQSGEADQRHAQHGKPSSPSTQGTPSNPGDPGNPGNPGTYAGQASAHYGQPPRPNARTSPGPQYGYPPAYGQSASGQSAQSTYRYSSASAHPTHGQSQPNREPSAQGQPTHGTSPGREQPAYGQVPAHRQSTYGQAQGYGKPPVHGNPAYGQPAYGPPAHGSTTNRRPRQESSAHAEPATASRDKRGGRGARATVVILSLLLPIGIVAGAVAGYTFASEFASLDTQAVEREVVAVLRDDYGLSDLSEVTCPDWIKVEQGESFQCEFEYAGAEQTVTVTQGSQSGQLVVGAPE